MDTSSKSTRELVRVGGTRRVACVSFGIVQKCDLFEATEMAGSGSGKIVRNLNIGLFVHEQDRMLSCLDMAFKPSVCRVPTYSEGVIFSTIPRSCAYTPGLQIMPLLIYCIVFNTRPSTSVERSSKDRVMMSPARNRRGAVSLAPSLDNILNPILQARNALWADEKGTIRSIT